MFCLVVLLGAVLAVQGQTTSVSQCTSFGSSNQLPLNVYIEGCTTPPCSLPQFQNAIIHIAFRAPRTMARMRTVATAFLGIIPIPYNLGANSVTCNFLTNTYCPVKEGDIVTYTLHMFIEEFMLPGIQVTVEFSIQDDNNSSFLCIRVPIRIVNGIQGRIVGQNELPAQ